MYLCVCVCACTCVHTHSSAANKHSWGHICSVLSLLLLQCVNHSGCLAIQNLVYSHRNAYLATVTNIKTPLTCHVQHTQQFSKMTIQHVKSSQSNLFKQLGHLHFQSFTTLNHIAQYALLFNLYIQTLHWYEFYYITRWLNTFIKISITH